jgi:CelD/BcsL family acetyltransferase involved in cellulose biosynthesis
MTAPSLAVTAAHVAYAPKVILARTPQELAPYAEAWNELLADSRANNVFLTWQWVEAWLKVVHPQAPLLTVIVREPGGRLLGIAPLYRSTLSMCGMLPFGCLRILGDRHTGAEYPDFILRRGHEHAALQAILPALLSDPNWHCIWLSKMAGWTGTYEFLCETCRKLRLSMRTRNSEFATIELPNNYEDWLQSLSRHRRSWLRRKTKHLFAAHQVEHVRPRSEKDLPQLLEALFDLHQKHWHSVGQPSAFERTPHKKPFYYHVAVEAFRRGWLRLDALKVDGQIKAVQYGYTYNGTVYGIQEGYDPEAFSSIGNVLRHLVIEQCIAEGISEYDFLAGFSEHKERWGGRKRLGYDLLIGRPCLRNKLLFAGHIWPTGRFLRAASPV